MIIQQPSKLLTQYGIGHGIAGNGYNFKREGTSESYQERVESVCRGLNISSDNLYHAIQTHSDRVAIVPVEHTESLTTFGGYPLIPEVDGFVTNTPQTTLLIRHADCTPIILYDKNNHVLAAVHSGWRSTVTRISVVALEAMSQLAGTHPMDIYAFIGPSIDALHYQVGREVYEAFEDIGNRQAYFTAEANDKYRLDMIAANRWILQEAGVPEEHIECSNESTYTSERLHSARQEGQDYQLNATFVMLP